MFWCRIYIEVGKWTGSVLGPLVGTVEGKGGVG